MKDCGTPCSRCLNLWPPVCSPPRDLCLVLRSGRKGIRSGPIGQNCGERIISTHRALAFLFVLFTEATLYPISYGDLYMYFVHALSSASSPTGIRGPTRECMQCTTRPISTLSSFVDGGIVRSRRKPPDGTMPCEFWSLTGARGIMKLCRDLPENLFDEPPCREHKSRRYIEGSLIQSTHHHRGIWVQWPMLIRKAVVSRIRPER